MATEIVDIKFDLGDIRGQTAEIEAFNAAMTKARSWGGGAGGSASAGLSSITGQTASHPAPTASFGGFGGGAGSGGGPNAPAGGPSPSAAIPAQAAQQQAVFLPSQQRYIQSTAGNTVNVPPDSGLGGIPDAWHGPRRPGSVNFRAPENQDDSGGSRFYDYATGMLAPVGGGYDKNSRADPAADPLSALNAARSQSRKNRSVFSTWKGEDVLGRVAAENIGSNGRVKKPFDDEKSGIHFGEGTIPEHVIAGREMQRSSAKAHLYGGFAHRILAAAQPSVDPMGNVLQQGLGAGASYAGAAGATGAAVGLGVGAAVVGAGLGAEALAASKNSSALSMERPLEQLAKMGFGSGGLKGDAFELMAEMGKNTGYSTQENTHIMREHISATGSGRTKADIRREEALGIRSVDLESMGISRGTANYYQSRSRHGNGTTNAAIDQGLNANVNIASAAGLHGDAATEYLSRMAASLQGLESRGFKIDSTGQASSAAQLGAYGLLGAGGDKNNALMFGNNAAQAAATSTSFQADAAKNMLTANGSMNNWAKGMMLNDAVKRINARGGKADFMSVGEEMEKSVSGGGNHESWMKSLEGNHDAQGMLLMSQAGGSMSHTQAAQYMRGRDTLQGRGKKDFFSGMSDMADTFQGMAASVRERAGSKSPGTNVENAAMAEQLTAIAKYSEELVELTKTQTQMVETFIRGVGYFNPKPLAEQSTFGGGFGH